MARDDDLERLRHMRDAAHKAVTFTENRDRCDLDSDEKLFLSVVRLLEIPILSGKLFQKTLSNWWGIWNLRWRIFEVEKMRGVEPHPDTFTVVGAVGR